MGTALMGQRHMDHVDQTARWPRTTFKLLDGRGFPFANSPRTCPVRVEPFLADKEDLLSVDATISNGSRLGEKSSKEPDGVITGKTHQRPKTRDLLTSSSQLLNSWLNAEASPTSSSYSRSARTGSPSASHRDTLSRMHAEER
jgi:hypothetical protein